MIDRWRRRRRSRRWVTPYGHRIVKFMPSWPPEKGDIVLVDMVRHRVVRVDVSWRVRHRPYEGRRFTCHELLVEPCPA
jgi:hypothetical protein